MHETYLFIARRMCFSYRLIAICYANMCSNMHIVLTTYTICRVENLFVSHLLCCVYWTHTASRRKEGRGGVSNKLKGQTAIS